MATHLGILAWEIPWTEEPGGLQFMGSQRVGHSLGTKQRMHMKPTARRKVLLPLPEERGEATVGGVGLVDGWMMQGERRDIQGGRFGAATVLAGGFFTTEPPGKPLICIVLFYLCGNSKT